MPEQNQQLLKGGGDGYPTYIGNTQELQRELIARNLWPRDRVPEYVIDDVNAAYKPIYVLNDAGGLVPAIAEPTTGEPAQIDKYMERNDVFTAAYSCGLGILTSFWEGIKSSIQSAKQSAPKGDVQSMSYGQYLSMLVDMAKVRGMLDLQNPIDDPSMPGGLFYNLSADGKEIAKRQAGKL
jgi:hypothetical protein